MNNLPGLSNDKQFNFESEFYVNYYKTFRVYYIYLFYLTNKRYQEAVGFCFKLEKYIKQVENSFNEMSKIAGKNIDMNKFKNELSTLSHELNQSKYKLQTAAILDNHDGSIEANVTDVSQTKEKLGKIVSYNFNNILNLLILTYLFSSHAPFKPLNQRLDVYFEDENLVNGNPNVIKLPLDFDSSLIWL